MAIRIAYPGIYIGEVATFHPIAGASTSDLAIVGQCPSGPIGIVQQVDNISDFDALYGCGAETTDTLRAGRQFFLQGGSVAHVVRILDDDYTAGLAALGDFNLLILPDAPHMPDGGLALYAKAAALCADRLAFLLIDHPRSANDAKAIAAWDIRGMLGPALQRSAALCFPRLIDAAGDDMPASGSIAGLIARVDAERGVWKAPAGAEAVLNAVKPSIDIPSHQQEALNLLGVNIIRAFPGKGTLNWGARTLASTDAEWKYVSVRRTALFIERSLREGLRWAASELNDEPLRARMRSSADTFMNGLFRQGAFQGNKPKDAYFVQCDEQSTRLAKLKQGLVTLQIGFAPMRPAEFVIVNLPLKVGGANA